MPEGTPERNFEEEIAEALVMLDQFPPKGTEYSREGLNETYDLTCEVIQDAITSKGITAVRGLALQIDVAKTARTTASRNKDQGGSITYKKRLDQYEEQYFDLTDNKTDGDEAPSEPTKTKERSMSSGKSAPAPAV